MTKHKRPKFDPEKEAAFELAWEEWNAQFASLEDRLRATEPLRMSPRDFCDDEQRSAWERALRGIEKESKAELLDFLNLNKPLSARLAAALAHILAGANLAEPNDFGEFEHVLRVEVRIKSARPAHRPRSPETMEKAFTVAKKVADKLREDPKATPTDVINDLAADAKVKPDNVRAAYRALPWLRDNLKDNPK